MMAHECQFWVWGHGSCGVPIMPQRTSLCASKMGDELFPKKDGKMLTSDIDYIDVWRGMEALQASGKVKSIGVSNFSILQLERFLALCRVRPAVNQLHPYLVQTEMIEFCKSKNITLTAYSPFGSPARPQEL